MTQEKGGGGELGFQGPFIHRGIILKRLITDGRLG
jgi:hypothetical protein